MKTKAFPPKFNSFAEILRSFTQNDPDRTILIYEEDGAPVRKSRADFAESVLARAEEMRSFGMTCLGVLCDGSLDCVETIFASAVAGLQTVLLDNRLLSLAWGCILLCHHLPTFPISTPSRRKVAQRKPRETGTAIAGCTMPTAPAQTSAAQMADRPRIARTALAV